MPRYLIYLSIYGRLEKKNNLVKKKKKNNLVEEDSNKIQLCLKRSATRLGRKFRCGIVPFCYSRRYLLPEVLDLDAGECLSRTYPL